MKQRKTGRIEFAVMLSTGSAMAGMLAGCGARLAPPLPPEAFVQHRPLGEYGAESPTDRTGPQYEGRRQPPALAQQRPTVSSAVEQAIPSPSIAQSRPATWPSVAATAEPSSTQAVPDGAGVGMSEYQIVGTVLTNVNGQPIYADKILSQLEPALSASARRAASEDTFRAEAVKIAQQQLDYSIHDELEFAAAQKSLSKSDQELASRLTTEWVNVQVRQAGGSEAVARQRLAQQGVDFEEIKRQQYRENMFRIYFEKRIKPLIHISAEQMRLYYEQNIRQYTVAAAARFRVIKIDAAGGHAQAIDRARKVFDQARKGVDFAALAAADNDDPLLKSTKGAVGVDGWMEKGAYAVEDVEREVWKLQPGQVTDPLDDGNAIYIAKLEELRVGKSQSFEDQVVQDKIFSVLWQQQAQEFRQQQIEVLMKESVVNPYPPDIRPLIDMIMQKYPAWAHSNS